MNQQTRINRFNFNVFYTNLEIRQMSFMWDDLAKYTELWPLKLSETEYPLSQIEKQKIIVRYEKSNNLGGFTVNIGRDGGNKHQFGDDGIRAAIVHRGLESLSDKIAFKDVILTKQYLNTKKEQKNRHNAILNHLISINKIFLEKCELEDCFIWSKKEKGNFTYHINAQHANKIKLQASKKLGYFL